MRSLHAIVVGACLAVAGLGGCSSGDDPLGGAGEDPCAAEPGSATDVETEPDWRRHGDYRPWTDGDGCLLRTDVVAERPGPEHCGWQDAEVLITGDPLGERYTSAADALHFVRDPQGAFGLPELAGRFVADDELPADAVDSGYRRDDVGLWHIPGDRSQVWLITEDAAERWPEGDPPLCE